MGTMVYKNKLGKRVPSVTTINGASLGWSKDVLMRWVYNSMLDGIDPFEKRDAACETGTLCHEFVEHHIYGVSVPQEELSKYTFEQVAVATRGLEQFKKMEKEYGIEWLETEYPRVSEEYQYGGCLDGVGKMGNKIFLGDIKTSNGIWAEHLVQLAAYRNLLYEEGKYNPEQYWIFKIKKDLSLDDTDIVKFINLADYVENIHETMDMCFELFVELRKMYDQKKVFDKITKSINDSVDPKEYKGKKDITITPWYKYFKLGLTPTTV